MYKRQLVNRVETIISAFSALRAKGQHVPLRADHSLYFLDAILPELPSKYANSSGETSSVLLWHRRLGHINAQSIKKLAEEKGTGMVVKDTAFSVSNCDIGALQKSRQQNHPKVARIEVTQPLRVELVYTHLLGPKKTASRAGKSYVAKSAGHHTRLKSVYFLRKKNEAIDALINYTQDVAIASGHRLQRLRSDRRGEHTGLEYRCLLYTSPSPRD